MYCKQNTYSHQVKSHQSLTCCAHHKGSRVVTAEEVSEIKIVPVNNSLHLWNTCIFNKGKIIYSLTPMSACVVHLHSAAGLGPGVVCPLPRVPASRLIVMVGRVRTSSALVGLVYGSEASWLGLEDSWWMGSKLSRSCSWQRQYTMLKTSTINILGICGQRDWTIAGMTES